MLREVHQFQQDGIRARRIRQEGIHAHRAIDNEYKNELETYKYN